MAVRPLTRDEARSIDLRAMQEYGIPGLVLMENAGRNSAAIIAKRYAETNRQACIVCGKGNNAGDGFVIARLLKASGYSPVVVLTEDPDSLSSDARFNYELLRDADFPMRILGPDPDLSELKQQLNQCDIIVDALVGTGLRGRPGGRLSEIIRCINEAGNDRPHRAVVSVDIPSGMDCDEGPGHEPGEYDPAACVQADLTITFVAEKAGFGKPSAKQLLGEVVVAEIGAPLNLLAEYQTPDP